ncbi:MAG: hypothetical protein U1D55_04395 [Phycisphaerae bacterium]
MQDAVRREPHQKVARSFRLLTLLGDENDFPKYLTRHMPAKARGGYYFWKAIRGNEIDEATGVDDSVFHHALF